MSGGFPSPGQDSTDPPECSTVANSGGDVKDMADSVDWIGKGLLHPEVMITHVGGLDSAAQATLDMLKVPGGMDEARRAALSESAASGEPAPLGQSVTPDGRPLATLIDGVELRPAITHPDERGTVTEIFDLRWQFDDDPLVFVYQVTIRPGQHKGWVMHKRHADRSFFSMGAMDTYSPSAQR